jgi:hypothetical protein
MVPPWGERKLQSQRLFVNDGEQAAGLPIAPNVLFFRRMFPLAIGTFFG